METTIAPGISRATPISLATAADRTLAWLVAAIVVLAAVAAAVGLFASGGPGGFTFTSVHGQSVSMYGQGLYKNDSLLIGSGYRGADAVVLVLGLPLLAISYVAYARRSLRGHLLLTGTLAFFLYQYASMAFGAAFNSLFPVYIALFGLCLFAFAIAFASVDIERLARAVSPDLPVRGIAAFFFVLFAVLALVWGSELIGNVLAGKMSERVDNYTTMITDVIDLGVILPAALVAGILVLRRSTIGYLLAATVLVVSILMGPALIGLSVGQIAAGVSFTPGEIIGPVMGFTLVALVGVAVAVVLLRNVDDAA